MLDVLFLYKDYAYNYAKISLVSELLKNGIKMECQKVENKEQAKQRYRPCDILLVNPEFFWDELKDSKICVALVSDVDGGWCSPHINLIPYVNGTIESYAYLPRKLHNLKHYCYCTELMAQAGFKRKTDVPNTFDIPEFSETDLQKIHVFCGFGSWERMKDIGNNEIIDLDAPRPDPIFFAGTVDYAGTEIEEHRMAAVNICNELGGLGVPGRLVQWPSYRERILTMKAVLSPWGWGEACHRDFEALSFGAVLIKPDWSFVESFPDISSHAAPYIPCKVDFSDVPAIVADLCEHWDSYRSLRERGLQLAKQALDVRANTKRFMEILQCLLK